MTIFFSSDHHFSHKNILQYANRPFSSVEEMDEEMIKRWNKVVSKNDTIYYLGDFTLGNDASEYLSRLKGNIKFVVPDFHHDKRWLENKPVMGGVAYLPPLVCEKIQDTWVFMAHYPTAVWDRKHYGAWHLYGHIHNKEFVLPGFAMNVGVDFHNFCPVSYNEIKQHMINLGWSPDWREFE